VLRVALTSIAISILLSITLLNCERERERERSQIKNFKEGAINGAHAAALLYLEL